MAETAVTRGVHSVLIVNASPLIHLAQAERLDLLRDAGGTVWVPEPVAMEVRKYGPDDLTARALAESPWIAMRAAPAVSEEIVAWDLGPGESAVLALARATPTSAAVMDDLAGRRCAEALGVPLLGTVGLVLLAKRDGRISSARAVLDALREHGMYLSDSVIEKALALVGER